MKELNNKFHCFLNLLIEFLEDTYLAYSKRSDNKTIKRFIKERERSYIKKTLQEGQEVLKIDPFPWKWIQDITNRWVYSKEKKEYVEDPESYKKWIAETLALLEKEAKKQGKL